MKKQTILKWLAIGVCVLSLSGCGTGQMEEQRERDMTVTEQHQNDMPLNEDENDDTADGRGDNGNKEEPLPNEESLPKEDTGSTTEGADVSGENQNNNTANGTGEKVDADNLYASAALTGSVVDFSEGGCTVSAAVTEEDGITCVSAAPGYESEDSNVVVTYQEDCVVQIATIYTSTGTAELEQASVADIKKQASLIIYGSYADTHHVSADRIIICHRIA
ncbi:MAG: hypothetical protein K2L82_16700 [Lachnospiraceae bacterium]|nr:hypothetical protein [Lachnospiraceae bacterium]